MRIFGRLLIVAALCWVGYILCIEAVKNRRTPTDEMTPEQLADLNTKTVLLFGGVVLVGISAGAIAAFAILPAIGDAVGHFFYAPSQMVEKDPHGEAVSLLAQGDFEGAVEAYTKIWEDNPSDTLAVSEIARIYCEKIERPDKALDMLEKALDHELPAEEGAFLGSRLADIYWNYFHDAIRAREILIQIAESLPDSRYAANAQHRILEIERALAEEESPPGAPAA